MFRFVGHISLMLPRSPGSSAAYSVVSTAWGLSPSAWKSSRRSSNCCLSSACLPPGGGGVGAPGEVVGWLAFIWWLHLFLADCNRIAAKREQSCSLADHLDFRDIVKTIIQSNIYSKARSSRPHRLNSPC